MWNSDPESQFNVEFWLVYISSTRVIATQEGVKIQQRDQNSTAKEGHNSTKNPLNIDPGSVFNWGGGGQNFILHRLNRSNQNVERPKKPFFLIMDKVG